MIKWILAGILLLGTIGVCPAQTPTKFVSSTGSGASTCTSGNPCTIARANAIAVPGDVIQVNDCPSGFCYAGTNNISTSGTAAQPITWISQTPHGAKFSGVTNIYGSFVNWRNMEISGSIEDAITTILNTATPVYGSFLQITGNYVHDLTFTTTPLASCPNEGNSGILIASGTHDSLIDGNRINNVGHWGGCPADGGSSSHGIYLSGFHNTITNNQVSNAAGYGIEQFHNPCQNIVANNTVFHNWTGGMQVAGANADAHSHQCDASGDDFGSMTNNLVLFNGFGVGGVSHTHAGILYGNSGVGANNKAFNNFLFGNSPSDSIIITAGGVLQSGNKILTTVTGLMVDYENNGLGTYQLVAGSLAIGAGTASTSACAISPGQTPCVPAKDIQGLNRLNPPSVGAFELIGGSSGTPVPAGTPSPLAFGNQAVNSCSASQTITLHNTGTGSFTINQAFTITPDVTNFHFAGGNCGLNQSIGTGSCNVQVQFCPTTTGALSAAYNFFTDSGNPSVPLTGTGTPPAAPVGSLSAANIPFANQSVNSISSVIPVTFTNTGTGPMTISSVNVADIVDFSETNNCPASLPAGNSCVINLTFHPTTTGVKSSVVNVAANTTPGTTSANLTGTPTQSSVAASVSSLTYSDTPVGNTTPVQVITLTNSGNGLAQMTISANGDYSQTNTCGNGFTDTFASGTLDGTTWVKDTGNAPGTIAGQNTSSFSTTNVDLSQGVLGLKVVQSGSSPTTSVGAEIRSLALYGYGSYDWFFRSASDSTNPNTNGNPVSGQVSSGFTFINNSQTELDSAEIEGAVSRNTLAEFTTWDSVTVSQNTNVTVATPWNTYHHYKVVWGPGVATYFVDGAQVAVHTQNVPSAPAAVMMNLWGTNNTNFGGVSTTGTRWMYFKSFSFVPASTTIPAGGTCTVSVAFHPTASGPDPGTLTVTVPDGGTNRTISLSGNGTITTNGVLLNGGVQFQGGVRVLN